MTFWRLFSKKSHGASDKITLQDFYAYFRRLSTEIKEVVDDESETFSARNNMENEFNPYEELDATITIEEVESAIKTLKREISWF